ncbi:MAG: hypothetical protein WAT79_04925 [Saprospiraceae bacterium]
MSNEVSTNRATAALAALGGLKQALTNVKSTLVVAGGDTLLRLMKDGIWVYGADNVEVETGSRWAINPLSIQHGFSSWSESGKGQNELIGEVMVPATMPLPNKAELSNIGFPNTGFPWNQQISFALKCMTGEDTGTELLYKTTSTGGLGMFNKLVGSLLAQLERDPANPVPVVELASSYYMHKKWGKTYTPEVTIVAWASMDGVESEPTAAPAPAAPAERKARSQAELAALNEPADPAPAVAEGVVRRRRNVA